VVGTDILIGDVLGPLILPIEPRSQFGQNLAIMDPGPRSGSDKKLALEEGGCQICRKKNQLYRSFLMLNRPDLQENERNKPKNRSVRKLSIFLPRDPIITILSNLRHFRLGPVQIIIS
jgi:hypothetical protein